VRIYFYIFNGIIIIKKIHTWEALDMKKKRILAPLLIVLLLCATVFVSFKYASPWLSNMTIARLSSDVDISFAVLGDVHGDSIKLKEAIHDLHRIRPEMDALILNGDTVNECSDAEYDSIKRCLEENSSYLPKTVIKNIGNHEFFDYSIGVNEPSEIPRFINKYLEFSGEKNVYHDKWINGYHFISLGSEVCNTKELGSTQAFISDEQQKWLKEKLSENHERGRPIFVFLHQHLRSNAPNASRGWVGAKQDAEVRNILSEYPEVILFTSHTHSSLKDINVTLYQPFTMAHTGAIYYLLTRDDQGNRVRTNDAQGLYVEVQGNKVTIRGWDFLRNSWIFTKEIPDSL